jgi:hypothetical protein
MKRSLTLLAGIIIMLLIANAGVFFFASSSVEACCYYRTVKVKKGDIPPAGFTLVTEGEKYDLYEGYTLCPGQDPPLYTPPDPTPQDDHSKTYVRPDGSLTFLPEEGAVPLDEVPPGTITDETDFEYPPEDTPEENVEIRPEDLPTKETL